MQDLHSLHSLHNFFTEEGFGELDVLVSGLDTIVVASVWKSPSGKDGLTFLFEGGNLLLSEGLVLRCNELSLARPLGLTVTKVLTHLRSMGFDLGHVVKVREELGFTN